MAKWTGKKVGVSYLKPDEPSFLKDFKKRAGYKEGTQVHDKFSEMPEATAEDLADNEEDLPQVVSVGKGCLSETELEALQQEGGRMKDLLSSGTARDHAVTDASGNTKILFKQRSKRPAEDTASDSTEEKGGKKERKKKKKKEEEKKKKLLSFDDEIDEE